MYNKPGSQCKPTPAPTARRRALCAAVSIALAGGLAAHAPAQSFPAQFALNTLDGSNGVALDGERDRDLSGESVSNIGDINGDGIDDVIVGAAFAGPNGTQSGRSYVVFGRRDGFDPNVQLSALDGSNGFVLDGEAAGDLAGATLAAAGDVNADGIDDLIIGAPRADPNGPVSGRSYVVFGRTEGFEANLQLSALDGSDGFKLDGEAAYDSAGKSVSGAGDVNGDGIDDLAIGASGADFNGFNSGRSYVVFGSSEGFESTVQLSALDGTDGIRIDGEAADNGAGVSVAAAGDVNADGIDDLVIGAPRADPNGSLSGRSYVVFGRTEGFEATVQLSALDGSNGFRLDGEAVNDFSGQSVSGAGDVNGDGIDDLLIGSYDDLFSPPLSGRSHVVFGDPDGFDATLQLSALDGGDGFKLDGSPGDYTGPSVSSAGDINGDGVHDLVIGAEYADPNGNNSGRSYVVFGTAGELFSPVELLSLDGTDGFKLVGEMPGDRSGGAVSAAGDVNGDGVDDVIIGARRADPNGDRSGRSYVVFGRVTGTPVLDFGGMKVIDFGAELVGSTGSSRTLELSNPGTGLVEVDTIDIAEPAFSITGGDCGPLPIRIPVDGSCALALRFAPDAAGSVTAEMRFAGTSVTSPDSVFLQATGLPAPVVMLMPDPLAFGDVAAGGAAVETLVVENTGEGVLEPGAVSILGDNADDFGVVLDGCAGAQLASGDFCAIDVEFAPGAPGVRSAMLRLDSNAPSSPHPVSMRGSSGVVFADGFEDRRTNE